MRSTYS